jgi:sporulation protein YlmC with PRC-barrel domain
MDPNLTSNQGAAIVGGGVGEGPGPEIMAASTLDDTKVYSSDDQHVGEIKEIMIDVPRGRVAYAVLTTGGFLGMTADRIKNAPGFNKDSWPRMADQQWATDVHRYYEREPYWMGNTPLL